MKGRMRQRATTFIRKMEDLLEGRIKNFDISLTATKKRKRSSDITLAEESWRDHKPKKNYFSQPKLHGTTKQSISITDDDSIAISTIEDLPAAHSTPIYNANITSSPISPICTDEKECPAAENIDFSHERFPWSGIHSYPTVPDKHKFGIELSSQNFWTLQPEQWLDDNIVNAFTYKLYLKEKRTAILNFDTLFSATINNRTTGFLKWGQNVGALEYKYWIIPHHSNNTHWTMLLVDFNLKYFVYFDSLHSAVPKNFIKHVIGYINALLSVNKKTEKWSEWTVFNPKDVPTQRTHTGIGGNCGVHVLIWAYQICSGDTFKFNETQMAQARMWITTELLETEVDAPKLKKKHKEIDLILSCDDAMWASTQHQPKTTPYGTIPRGFISTFDYVRGIQYK